MDLLGLRNELREWFRVKAEASPILGVLPLVVPNETGSHGIDVTWLRFSVQTGEADVTGIGSGTKRRTRAGRVFVEVFGEKAVGDGYVTEVANEVEQIWREATTAANSPHQNIYIREPHTFERADDDRYCQVVSVPFRADLFF